MASIFTIPSLKTLVTRVAADYKAELGSDATIRRTFPYALSRATAGVVHGVYGLISKAIIELHPWTASSYGITFWASVLGVTRREAQKAVLVAVFTGENGSIIPVGTLLVRDDHAEYVTVGEEATISGGGVSVSIEANAAGAAGNCEDETTLTVSTPISGVTSAVTVLSTATTGTDEETLSSLKTRYLAVLASPPQGGATADYQKWTREVTGIPTVDRVWVSPLWAGEGTVLVRFSVYGDSPVPDSEAIEAVEDYIDVRRPVTAHVTVAAPATTSWEFAIDLVVQDGHDVADVQAAIYAELRSLFRTIEPGATVPHSVVDAALSRATGEASHEVQAMSDGSGFVDFDDLVNASGTIPILGDGDITWV